MATGRADGFRQSGMEQLTLVARGEAYFMVMGAAWLLAGIPSFAFCGWRWFR